MEQLFTVKEDKARPFMFACRLSPSEYEAFEDFLGLAFCCGESKSDLFRSILLELKGRMSRDYLKHLRYKTPSYEMP